MSFVLHQMTKPFIFGILKKINNYRYSMGTQKVFAALNFRHLMVLDICVLDLVTKPFVYGILKHPNHYIHNGCVNSVKYESNELGINGANTILSGSEDKSVRLWDIRCIGHICHCLQRTKNKKIMAQTKSCINEKNKFQRFALIKQKKDSYFNGFVVT
ncbi:hypothetical protein RFI_02468 [Reticulomyxa filosa]|uniref:Uncharacterized protein n=1 Tax=Reticulomyxa filosa TaxID=46433 RepID=X6P935_RETFI|nr:hypothetical protein RFI_02468 [Reticulomyxa filosa]|eukprot:ETO34623.1 hypothetical protein RFI_02468 [Reticulomyxa filosa]